MNEKEITNKFFEETTDYKNSGLINTPLLFILLKFRFGVIYYYHEQNHYRKTL